MEPPVVPPVDPARCGELDLLDRPPAPPAADQLGLVQPVDRLGQGVVIAVALGAHRVDGPSVSQALGIAAARSPSGSSCRPTCWGRSWTSKTWPLGSPRPSAWPVASSLSSRSRSLW